MVAFLLLGGLVGAVVLWLGGEAGEPSRESGRTPDDASITEGAEPTDAAFSNLPMFDASASPEEVMASIVEDFCTAVTVGPLDNGPYAFVTCMGTGTEYEINFSVFADRASLDTGWDATGCIGTREAWAQGPGLWTATGEPEDVSTLVEMGGGAVVVTCDDAAPPASPPSPTFTADPNPPDSRPRRIPVGYGNVDLGMTLDELLSTGEVAEMDNDPGCAYTRSCPDPCEAYPLDAGGHADILPGTDIVGQIWFRQQMATSRGIRTGDSESELLGAYPEATTRETSNQYLTLYVVAVRRGANYFFYVSEGRVGQLILALDEPFCFS